MSDVVTLSISKLQQIVEKAAQQGAELALMSVNKLSPLVRQCDAYEVYKRDEIEKATAAGHLHKIHLTGKAVYYDRQELLNYFTSKIYEL